MDEEKTAVTVDVHVDMSEVDAATEKVERLNRLLREAKSLIQKLGTSSVTITPTSVYTTVGSGSSGCIGGWQTGTDPSHLRCGLSTGEPTFPENLQGQI